MTEPAPTPTPPGTSAPTFWENPATKTAIAATFPVVWAAVWSWGAWDLTAIRAGAEIAAWAWLAAMGIHKTDSDALRWR